MDLDARPYRAFLGIAETGSFSRAAELLNVSQPALSAQLREFERLLGFALFTRNSRRVELTAEGALFLDKARRFVMETNWVRQAAREVRTNQLRIGAAHFTGLIAERCALIDSFMTAHPNVPLTIVSRTPAQLTTDLSRNDIDLAVTIEPLGVDTASAVEQLGAVEVEQWVLGRRPIGLLAPYGSWEATCGTLALADIAGREIGTLNRSHGVPLSEAIARRLGRAGANLLHLPEADAPSLARYGALLGKLVIDLGWFDTPGMAPCRLEGLGLETALTVKSRSTGRRPGANRFLEVLDAQLSPS